MKKRKLPGVNEYQDRHGKWRAKYLPNAKQKKQGFVKSYSFKNPVGSEEFWDEYNLCKRSIRPDGDSKPPKPKTRTLNDLALYYYDSHDFKILAEATRKNYRRIISNFLKEYGKFNVTAFTAPLVREIMEMMADAPTQANLLRKRLKKLFEDAVFLDWIQTNPIDKVKPLRVIRKGHHTWSEEEIAAFEKKHATGSKARLAFAIYLYTGVRRSDAVTLGRQHIKSGKIRIRARKNKKLVQIPIHPLLQKEIDQLPDDQMQFLLTDYGKPFSVAGFGNKMRDWCKDAGLPGCSAHGLRKAISVRMYEAGATKSMIGAVLADNVGTVEIYIEDAKNEKLAEMAFAKMD